ncbi:hypothetical protein B0T14DRAFT_506740 [Immersiella caudata]|uniref:DUF3074 domain-containing protein n=1 Tax=Immersiella caudata TaxID=314043 RepID=A0AA39XHX0_9PEZI|nr:hypothetical protein B0T14DRAFT_506740 [Immersiella caudata]
MGGLWPKITVTPHFSGRHHQHLTSDPTHHTFLNSHKKSNMPLELLTLNGLSPSDLPPQSAPPDALAPFLTSILEEAIPFIDSVAPKISPSHSPSPEWASKGSKTYSTSDATVQLFQRVVDTMRSGADKGETWICRRSVHADSDETGKKSANWDEFWNGFKERHVEVEREFTGSVVGVEHVWKWEGEGLELPISSTTYTSITLTLHLIRHRIGRPILKDRTFPILLFTCAASRSEFLTITLPVPSLLASSEISDSTRKKYNDSVIGSYVSAERIRKMEDSGEIEWIMTTASDAKGVLPMWVQNRAVPGQIAKDVPNFLTWAARERAKAEGK